MFKILRDYIVYLQISSSLIPNMHATKPENNRTYCATGYFLDTLILAEN